jgi:putative membrane protein
VSGLDDPRVLFAAERTLMAWSRTAAGLMALGFLVERSAVLLPSARAGHPAFAYWIGIAFVVLGVMLSALSLVQYRRAVRTLRTPEIPPGYWVNLSAYAAAAVGLLGVALAAYLTVA